METIIQIALGLVLGYFLLQAIMLILAGLAWYFFEILKEILFMFRGKQEGEKND